MTILIREISGPDTESAVEARNYIAACVSRVHNYANKRNGGLPETFRLTSPRERSGFSFSWLSALEKLDEITQRIGGCRIDNYCDPFQYSNITENASETPACIKDLVILE